MDIKPFQLFYVSCLRIVIALSVCEKESQLKWNIKMSDYSQCKIMQVIFHTSYKYAPNTVMTKTDFIFDIKHISFSPRVNPRI
jgi:hypothetical protein